MEVCGSSTFALKNSSSMPLSFASTEWVWDGPAAMHLEVGKGVQVYVMGVSFI